ncbi:MAG TPA: hypothetical protein VI136_01850 [Verrucomicrobiae bacterium]
MPDVLSNAADPISALVGKAVAEFIAAKTRAGRSDRYIRTLRNSLSKFSDGRARRALDSVTTAELERWLAASRWRPRTQRGYLADVRTFFSFALRRGLCTTNPANAVEVPTLPPGAPPGIHSPAQVRAVLETARRIDPDTCRLLAVRYFAGVRSADAHRLTEENFRGDVLEVPAAKSKTRARRLVKIEANLAAWLALPGKLPVSNPDRVRAVIRAAGIHWPRNATRHSFCSYHLAHFGNAARTALEAGHSEAMLFAHYRELVTPEAAAAFWAIAPEPPLPPLPDMAAPVQGAA